MKLRDLFYELLAIPLLVPLLHNFVSGELIQNVGGNGGGGYTYLILSNNESGNFDGTWVNRGTENLVEFTNNGNGNWNFMYDADNYTNIWRLNSNNEGYYYGLQTYYFFSNNKLYFHKAGLSNGATVEVNNFRLFDGTGGLADYSNFGDNNTTYTYSLSDVVSSIGNVDSIIYGVYTYDRQGVFNYSRNIICFGNNNTNVYYCSTCISNDYAINPFCLGGNSSVVDLGLNVNSTILDIVPLVSDSPFTGGPGGGGGSSRGDLVELESAYNVSEVLNAYGEMGYTNNLCYGNFALDDLAVSGSTQQFFEQDLDDGVYFTGATIFDLYRVYSGGYNFNTFMNSWLARFYPSYTNDISLGFIGYSKALWYNQYLIYIHRPTIQNFSYQNLYNFCYLSVAINDGSVSLDDNFNNSMINNGSLPSSVEEELESPGSVLVPGTGSIFNGSGFVPGSGGAGGGGRSRGEGEEPSDAYGLFARLFDYISGLTEAFDLGLTKQGFLPSVIQFGFLVALLYYILKR